MFVDKEAIFAPFVDKPLVPLCADCLNKQSGILLVIFRRNFEATISFFMSVCLSVCLSVCSSVRPHGTTRLPLDEFSLNLIFEYFSKICGKNSSALKCDKHNGTIHEDLCAFMITSRWILLRMRNVSDKICRENENTHFMFNNLSQKVVPFMSYVEKYGSARQATDDNITRSMRLACCITKTRIQTHNQNI
jgi:hypothetical protein